MKGHEGTSAIYPVYDDAEAGGARRYEYMERSLVLQMLLVEPALYAADYAIAAALAGAFQIDLDGTEPFDHSVCAPVTTNGVWRPLVNWITLVLTFALVGPWLIYFIVRDAHRAVDAATAMATMHFFLCTTVTQAVPENWVWFSTLLPLWLWLGQSAEFLLSRCGHRLGRRRLG